jgi:hypothetical protein
MHDAIRQCSLTVSTRRSWILHILPWLILCLLSVKLNAQTVIFEDDFNRSDSSTVGNGWTESQPGTTNSEILSNALHFVSNDVANGPIVQHTFTAQSSGYLTWSFKFNWDRIGSENDYELWMQLGDSATMVPPGTSDSTGVAVNLKWGGTNHGLDYHEGFGYVSGGGASTTTLSLVSGSADIEVYVDLGSNTYDLVIDSSVVATSLPFDNDVDIDTVRIYTNVVNDSNFSGESFDDISIVSGGTIEVFTDVTSSVGFDQQTTSSYIAGWHWADIDNDGDLDAIATGSSSKIFINVNAGSTFFTSSFGDSAVIRQAAFLDFDNDGDLEFFGMPTYYTERFWLNDGAGGMTNQGDLGFSSPNNNEGVAAADVNLDGLCDMVVFAENGNWIGFNQGTDPATFTGTNNGSYGLNDSGDEGNGDYCSSGDVNGDGSLDFFYHYNSGKLFLSDGDGTYTQSNGGISVYTGNDDKMGSAFADYDNDGDLDLYVCRYDAGQRGYLWQNTGGSFSNVASAAGITNTDNQVSCAWGDYDNDGDLDLYITTQDDGNMLYRNNGDGTFGEVSSVVNVSDDCHDACFVDYDNDGDLDLALIIEDADCMLFRNDIDDTNYLKVRVVGAGLGATNAAGVGVRIDLYDASGTTFLQRREIGVARGYGGSEPLWAHFGGVDPSATYTVRVYFVSGILDTSVTPSSASTTIGSKTIDQMVTIEEPSPNEDLRVIRWIEVDPNN